MQAMELADWANADRLAEWATTSTDNLLAAVSEFDDDDERWIGPYLPIVNPPIWEIAHAAWFAEWFVLRQLHGRAPLIDDVDARYDSAKVMHRTRWNLNYPDPTATKDYVRRVADGLVEVLANQRGIDSTEHFVAYAITHYDAHGEALAYTRQTLDWATSSPLGQPVEAATTPTSDDGRRDLRVDGGEFLLGASRQQPMVMDNEKWAHLVRVDTFDMAATTVTIAEFAEFVDADGYATDALWSPEGLAWRHASAVSAPAYWRRGADGWERRIGSSWQPIELTADHPMMHVAWFEAQAFCAWAGRRLPTELEWERAATVAPTGAREPWFPWGNRDPLPNEAALDGRSGGTVPVGAFADGDGPWGHRQLIGNVWEWTDSTFDPYPHFEPDAYRDNSEPWFGSRKVLRGGSWATQHRYVRSTFRNFFTPDRRDVFAGFRTCAR